MLQMGALAITAGVTTARWMRSDAFPRAKPLQRAAAHADLALAFARGPTEMRGMEQVTFIPERVSRAGESVYQCVISSAREA